SSRPSRAAGMVSRWIGRGEVKPASAMPRWILEPSAKAAKPSRDGGVEMVFRGIPGGRRLRFMTERVVEEGGSDSHSRGSGSKFDGVIRGRGREVRTGSSCSAEGRTPAAPKVGQEGN